MAPSESDLMQKLCSTYINDRAKTRRWRNIRFFTWIALLLLIIFLIVTPAQPTSSLPSNKEHFALIRLKGVIMPGSAFSAEHVIPELDKAFADKKAQGVLLLINSPGGTPTQASIIHDKIIALKKEYHKKVIVVGEDALTSGAYLVATAADKIYVNRDTITGSIGVIMSSFGLTKAIQKLGITRRVYTAGVNKDRLDPFLPSSPADKEKMDAILRVVHQNFITDVKNSRGDKLQKPYTTLFSGDFWLGQEATQLGLVDGTKNMWEAAQQEFNTTHYIDYSTPHSLFGLLMKGMQSITHLSLLTEHHSQLLAEQM